MSIKSSADLCKDNDDIERQEEWNRLRAKLESAEASRLAGARAYTIEESWEQLEEIFAKG